VGRMEAPTTGKDDTALRKERCSMTNGPDIVM
jgi:hypothetical protein